MTGIEQLRQKDNLKIFVVNFFTLVISGQKPKTRHPAVSSLLEDCADPSALNLPQ
jgi:hypothetical protein